VDARTHAKITTGKSENKFGVAIADAPALYARMAATPGIRPVGVAVHIGSQITSGMAAYRTAYAHLASWCGRCARRALPVEVVDCGGGLGIPYRNEPAPSPAALGRRHQGDARHPRRSADGGAGALALGPAGVLLSS
jgi:diaminopimelate decarboxylase